MVANNVIFLFCILLSDSILFMFRWRIYPPSHRLVENAERYYYTPPTSIRPFTCDVFYYVLLRHRDSEGYPTR